jgi:hypothetical protein
MVAPKGRTQEVRALVARLVAMEVISWQEKTAQNSQ